MCILRLSNVCAEMCSQTKRFFIIIFHKEFPSYDVTAKIFT